MRQVAKKGLLTAVATGGVLAVTTGGMAYADSTASGVAAGSPGVLSGNTIQAPVNIPINACGNTVNVVGLLNPAAGNTCVNGSIDHGKGHGYGQGKGYGKKESGGYGGGKSGGYGQGGGKGGKSGGYGGGKGYGQGGSKGYGGGKGYGKGHDGDEGYGHRGGGASARAAAVGSPGVLSGNVIQAPINIPVNVCGNTIDVIGILNPAAGNTCANTGGYYHHEGKGHHHKPGHHGNRHKPGKENEGGGGGGGGAGGGGGGGGGGGNQPQSMGHGGGPSLARTGAGDIATGLLTSAGLLLGGAVLFRRARAVKN